jgi:hypothetical protein
MANKGGGRKREGTIFVRKSSLRKQGFPAEFRGQLWISGSWTKEKRTGENCGLSEVLQETSLSTAEGISAPGPRGATQGQGKEKREA